MKSITYVLLALFLSSCATSHWERVENNPRSMNLQEAYTNCRVKQVQANEDQTFMQLCMKGQGFVLIETPHAPLLDGWLPVN